MVPLSTTNVVGSAILGNQLVMETLERWKSLLLNALNSHIAASAGFEDMYSDDANAKSQSSILYQHLVWIKFISINLMRLVLLMILCCTMLAL